MPAFPFDPSTFRWNPGRPHAAGTFRPHGPLEQHGETWRSNPEAWSTKRTISARLIVGFSVGAVPTYKLDDLVEIVRRVRLAQTGNPDASFIAQRGIYQHHNVNLTVTEDGAQVFIINLSDASMQEFTAQMVELAETIAREMQQETVIVEIQKNGVSRQTIGVSP